MQKIVDIAGCYRKGELERPFDIDHIQRWVQQFDEGVQKPLLDELAYVLERTYIERVKMKAFLQQLFNAIESDDSKCDEWKNINLLQLQQRGNSQREMLALFDEVLHENCQGSVTVNDCNKTNVQTYIYLDDFIFTGFRLKTDLENWIINYAPQSINLYVITYGSYAGSWNNKQNIEGTIKQTGKNINLQFIEQIKIENRKTYSSSSDVLWPSGTPSDQGVIAFEAGLINKPYKRAPVTLNNDGIFSSETSRQLLEQQFLIKGVEIINASGNFPPAHKPLGFLGFDSFGFGAMHLTYRNCPNNAPLALWAGSPWYPLFPRKNN